MEVVSLAVNIFELFGTIGADEKPASRAIDNVVSKARQADHTLSNGMNKIGKLATGAGTALTNYITKPAIAAGSALVGITLVRGFGRLVGIDTARAKLEGLGHDGRSIENIMTSALDSVRGTAFGLDEAATTAANAVAAGVEPGKELTRYLTLTGDAAAIAGAEMGEMGGIINKVTTAGKAYNGELRQLSDRGLPIYQWLAEEAGVTADAVFDMASEGKISTEMFLNAIENNIGGAAKIMGEKSFTAAIANIGASIGRIGANFLDAGGAGGGFFSTIKPLLTDFRISLEGVEEKAKEWGETFGQAFQGVIDQVTQVIDWYKALDSEAQASVRNAAAGFSVLAVGAGPALKVFGNLASAGADVTKFFEDLNSKAGKKFTDFSKKLTDGFGKARTTFSNLGDSISNGVGKGFTTLQEKIPLVGRATDGVKGTFSKLQGTVKGTMDKVPDVFGKVASGAQNVVSKGTSVVSSVVGQTTQALTTVVGLAMKMIGPGILLGAVLVGLGLVQGAFGEQINEFLNIAATQGPLIIQRLIDGAVSKLPEIMILGTELLVNFLNAINANLPTLLQGGILIVSTLLEGVAQQLPMILGAAIPIIGTLLEGIIIGLPQLLLGGLSILQGLLDGIFQNSDLLISTATSVIETFGQSVESNLPQIIDKGINILVSLIEGVSSMLPNLIPLVLQLFVILVNAILSNLPRIIDGGIRILNALIDGVVNMIPQLPPLVAQIFASLVSAIVSNLPQILQKGIELLGKLGEGIIKAIPALLRTVPQVFREIRSAFRDTDWMSIGKNIISGIGRGIRNSASALWDAAKGVLGSFKDNVLGFFGINSPSRWGRDAVGRFIPQGIGVGIEKDADEMQKSLDHAVKGLKVSPEVARENMFTPYEQSPRSAVNKEMNRMNIMLERLLLAMESFAGQSQEVVVQVDGHTIAKATRDPLDRELGKKNRDKSQAKGRK